METNQQNQNYQSVQNFNSPNGQQSQGQPVQNSSYLNGSENSNVMQNMSAMYYEKKFMVAYLEEKQELHNVFSKMQFEKFVLNHMKSSPDQMLSDYVKQYKQVLEKYFRQVGVQNISQQIDQVVIGFVKKYNRDFISYATRDKESLKK